MAEKNLEVRVVCYAGHRGEESPQRFYLGERVVEVSEIIDRWLDPKHRYYKLRGNDEGIYILRHDNESGIWELIMFDSGKIDQTRLSST